MTDEIQKMKERQDSVEHQLQFELASSILVSLEELVNLYMDLDACIQVRESPERQRLQKKLTRFWSLAVSLKIDNIEKLHETLTEAEYERDELLN